MNYQLLRIAQERRRILQEPTEEFVRKTWDSSKTPKQNIKLIRKVWNEIHNIIQEGERKEEAKRLHIQESPPVHKHASPEYNKKKIHKRIYSHTPIPDPVIHMMGGELTPREARTNEYWTILRNSVMWNKAGKRI